MAAKCMQSPWNSRLNVGSKPTAPTDLPPRYAQIARLPSGERLMRPRNVKIEYRLANDRNDQLPGLATELWFSVT